MHPLGYQIGRDIHKDFEDLFPNKTLHHRSTQVPGILSRNHIGVVCLRECTLISDRDQFL